jgi:hypothetical protein
MKFSEILGRLRAQRRRQRAIANIRASGCWFVDIPRTSSSSIRAELGRIYGEGFGKSNLFEKEHATPNVLADHLPATDAREVLGGDFWQAAFTFSFVRNPWDRFLSIYFFRVRNGEIAPTLSFTEYARQMYAPRYRGRATLHSYPAYYYSMSDYLLDPDGNLLVDFVGRYETRQSDLAVVADRLGVEFSGLHLQRAAPEGRHYSEYYDPESWEIVARVYAEDIERFGYAPEARWGRSLQGRARGTASRLAADAAQPPSAAMTSGGA